MPISEGAPIQVGLAEVGWSFLPFIFGVDDVGGGRREQLAVALQRYTAAVARHRSQD